MNNPFVFVVTVGLSLSTIKEAVLDENNHFHDETITYMQYFERDVFFTSVSASQVQ
jgi:hypothetical protein